MPLQCQVDSSLFSSATGTSAFLSRRIRAIDPHVDLSPGKQSSSLLVAGNSAFPSSGDVYVRKLLEFHKAC